MRNNLNLYIMKQFIKNMLSAESGVSSKRVAGFLG